MTSAPAQPSEEPLPGIALPALAVFLISAAVLGLELALMRCLSVAGWHHFSYLVISTALLGFGVSGTLLSLVGQALERHFGTWAVILTLAFALSVTLCFRAAQALPVDPQYVLYSARQAALMVVYHMAFFVPFLLAATVIGLSLMHFGERVHVLYGANLLGSGTGSLAMVFLMFVLAEVRLLYAVAALSLLAGLIWTAYVVRTDAARRAPSSATSRGGLMRGRPGVMLGLALAVVAATQVLLGVLWPLELRIDQYKMLAVVRRWEAQSDAHHLLSRHSPRGRLDLYESGRFHHTLFAGLTAVSAPPPQLMILADGAPGGVVFEIESAQEAEILDHTPMSVPYRLQERPHVLLLGETGGANVWLARRWKAPRVTVVQRNPQIIRLLKGPLAQRGGRVFSLPGVEVVPADPRLFLERAEGLYDIIQLVPAESMAAGVSSMLSLHEDYLLTTESVALCLRRLRPGGFLAITRGIQSPPRDNVKILATVAEALESLGIARSGRHVVQLRNYLAVTTLATPTPVEPELCEALFGVCDELGIDLEWAPCAGLNPSAQRARIPGPPGAEYSYYHYAAREIFSSRREQFFGNWAYNVQPASDDSPYFYNFFRWESLPLLQEVHGKHWFRKLELGYLVVAAALGEVVVVGSLLILLPLLWLRRQPSRRGARLPTAVYFLLLGISFMMLEMVLILKFTRFLGDPILSAGGILGAFLVFSGLGSVASGRMFRSPTRAIGVAALGIGVITIGYVFLLDGVFSLAASWPTAGRFALSMLLAAPLAFLMGWPFPTGLACLRRGAPALVPWAWGANGFASVAGSPAAVLLAVSGGFSSAMLLAALLYGCAGLLAWKLPGAHLSR